MMRAHANVICVNVTVRLQLNCLALQEVMMVGMVLIMLITVDLILDPAALHAFIPLVLHMSSSAVANFLIGMPFLSPTP